MSTADELTSLAGLKSEGKIGDDLYQAGIAAIVARAQMAPANVLPLINALTEKFIGALDEHTRAYDTANALVTAAILQGPPRGQTMVSHVAASTRRMIQQIEAGEDGRGDLKRAAEALKRHLAVVESALADPEGFELVRRLRALSYHNAP